VDADAVYAAMRSVRVKVICQEGMGRTVKYHFYIVMNRQNSEMIIGNHPLNATFIFTQRSEPTVIHCQQNLNEMLFMAANNLQRMCMSYIWIGALYAISQGPVSLS
jgi:hypothetical protein